jgi:hypothetical protein
MCTFGEELTFNGSAAHRAIIGNAPAGFNPRKILMLIMVIMLIHFDGNGLPGRQSPTPTATTQQARPIANF